MKKIIIATSGAPEAIGPYSQAVKAKGEMLYVSGQLPIDPVSKKLVEDNISLQTHQSLKNLKAILEEANMGFENVVKTTVLLKDIQDFNAMNEVYAQYFEKDCPARAAFQIATLPMNARVEIEAVAIKE